MSYCFCQYNKDTYDCHTCNNNIKTTRVLLSDREIRILRYYVITCSQCNFIRPSNSNHTTYYFHGCYRILKKLFPNDKRCIKYNNNDENCCKKEFIKYKLCDDCFDNKFKLVKEIDRDKYSIVGEKFKILKNSSIFVIE